MQLPCMPFWVCHTSAIWQSSSWQVGGAMIQNRNSKSHQACPGLCVIRDIPANMLQEVWLCRTEKIAPKMMGRNRNMRPELCVPSTFCFGRALSSSSKATTIAFAKRMVCKTSNKISKIQTLNGHKAVNWDLGHLPPDSSPGRLETRC